MKMESEITTKVAELNASATPKYDEAQQLLFDKTIFIDLTAYTSDEPVSRLFFNIFLKNHHTRKVRSSKYLSKFPLVTSKVASLEELTGRENEHYLGLQSKNTTNKTDLNTTSEKDAAKLRKEMLKEPLSSQSVYYNSAP